MMPRSATITPLALTLALAGTLAGLSGCRGERTDKPPRQFIPDMDDGPKWKPQARTGFYADGRTMRPTVAGTVAFGRSSVAADEARADLLREDAGFYLGRVSAPGSGAGAGGAEPAFIERMPVEVTAPMIERGQERFNIYCSVCHGYDGKGKGLVGDPARRTGWSYALPNFHDKAYTDRNEPKGKDGYLFHVIRNGVLNPDGTWKMPPYGHAVDEADAWAIVAYLRTLQAVYAGQLADVPEAERAKLMSTRPAKPVAAPAAPAPGGGNQ